MGSLRTETSKKSDNYLPKHRYLELKHLCLQYPEWKKELALIGNMHSASVFVLSGDRIGFKDPTFDITNKITFVEEKIRLVEDVCEAVDPAIAPYLLLAVTEGRTYEYLRGIKGIPCGRRQFYEKYRRFFMLLDEFVR